MSALIIKQLTKRYANGTIALHGIDLSIDQSDFFALLGPNGAGKSTTIGIICSLINKTSGKIYVFGHDTDQELMQAKSLIGVVPQELNFGLFEKVSHILINQAGYYGVPKKIALQRMEYVLKEVDLWDMRYQPAIRLSGGMKRRLLIARALMSVPKLLILDEPTAGVDIEIRHLLWKLLNKLNQQGTTIILTTHYLEEAEQLCKHIAIIDHGRIIKHTNMKSLINQLHTQTLVLDLTEPLAQPPTLPGYQPRLADNNTLEIEINRDTPINELFRLLTQQHIYVSSIRNKINRLEELFVRLVGKNKQAGDVHDAL